MTVNASSNSANFSMWNRLADIDAKIDSDAGDIENQCDYLYSDAQGFNYNNVSSYDDAAKADQLEINSLMVQRKNILSSLGY